MVRLLPLSVFPNRSVLLFATGQKQKISSITTISTETPMLCMVLLGAFLVSRLEHCQFLMPAADNQLCSDLIDSKNQTNKLHCCGIRLLPTSYYALHFLISHFIQQIEHAEERRNGGTEKLTQGGDERRRRSRRSEQRDGGAAGRRSERGG
jgi:hypothetical protein